MIIYFPGIIGALIALASVQMPLLGRKWSLVFSALCQGLSMALYTQVSSTAAYVGLNALEYIMQTVRTSKPCVYILLTNLVFQRRFICVCSRVIRHCLPRKCQWHAVVPRSHSWNSRTVRWRSVPCRKKRRYSLARSWWHLAFRGADVLLASRNEEPANVLRGLGALCGTEF